MQRASQRERILHLLQAHEGEWIPAYKLVDISLRYGARIQELRKEGHHIENKKETVNGQCHSAYRIVCASESNGANLDALLANWHARLTSVPAAKGENSEKSTGTNGPSTSDHACLW